MKKIITTVVCFLSILLFKPMIVYSDSYLAVTPNGKIHKLLPDKALLHIIRPSNYGRLSKIWTFLDDKVIGANIGSSQFSALVEPGKYLFWNLCSGGMESAYVDLKPGKTYYIKQAVGFSGIDVFFVSEQKAAEWVNKYEVTHLTDKGVIRGAFLNKKKIGDAKRKAKPAMEIHD
jgi:hypothetical protein